MRSAARWAPLAAALLVIAASFAAASPLSARRAPHATRTERAPAFRVSAHGLTLEVPGPRPTRVWRMDAPYRIVMDFPGAPLPGYERLPRTEPLALPGMIAMRRGQATDAPGGPHARLTLVLSHPVPYTVSWRPGFGTRLVLRTGPAPSSIPPATPSTSSLAASSAFAMPSTASPAAASAAPVEPVASVDAAPPAEAAAIVDAPPAPSALARAKAATAATSVSSHSLDLLSRALAQAAAAASSMTPGRAPDSPQQAATSGSPPRTRILARTPLSRSAAARPQRPVGRLAISRPAARGPRVEPAAKAGSPGRLARARALEALERRDPMAAEEALRICGSTAESTVTAPLWERLALLESELHAAPERIEAHSREALRRGAESVSLDLCLARVLDRRARYDEAARWYRRASQVPSPLATDEPLRVSARFLWADALYRRGSLSDALDAYTEALGASPAAPEVPWALYQAAKLYQRLGSERRARETFSQLASRFPDDYWTRQARARFAATGAAGSVSVSLAPAGTSGIR